MRHVREPQLAGTWYPADERACLEAIRQFAEDEQTAMPRPGHAAIVPHAGWRYSGRIAYRALHALACQSACDTVVLFAGHLRPTDPVAVLLGGDYWTPLGLLRNDEALANVIAERVDATRETPQHHGQDNSTEVELPLIKALFASSELVVVSVPPDSTGIEAAAEVHNAAEELGRTIVAVGSTDLTHYGPNFDWTPRGVGEDAYSWVTKENDPSFVSAVLAMDPEQVIVDGLTKRNACCPGAAAAAIRVAQAKGATTGMLSSYSTSADIHASDSFVGYAGLVLY